MRHVDRFGSFGVVVSVLLIPGLFVGYAQPAGAQEHVVRIEVTLAEFAFVPDPLRVPAGEEVVLVIKNDGVIAHEFMAGRDAEGNDFKQDLFADLHVNIEQADTADAEHAEHNEDAGHVEHAEQSADAQEDAHGEGHAHGTMVEAGAGETFLMTFTLPEDRRGEWSTGCFLKGHYDAGMHGTLIVE